MSNAIIKKFKLFLALPLMISLTTAAMAVESAEKRLVPGQAEIPIDPAQEAAEIFYGGCFHYLDDLSKVELIARNMSWKPAPKELLDQTKPKKSEGNFKGWTLPNVVNKGQVFLIINKGKGKDGTPLNICSVIIKISKDQIIDALKKQLTINDIKEEKQTFQMKTSYSSEHPRLKDTLIQVFHDGKGNPPINITVVGVKQK